MMRTLVAAFICSLCGPLAVAAQAPQEAQSQNVTNHVITVSRGGEAFAKPDLGILLMTLRSSGPIAEEAVVENGRKAKSVETALTALGFTPAGYKITAVVIGEAGSNRYGPNQPEITAYEASQFVYVFFEAADMNDAAHFAEKTASVIEALRKAGAVPGHVAGPRMPQVQEGLILCTVKDSVPYERAALKQAVGRARDAAQDIAAGMGV